MFHNPSAAQPAFRRLGSAGRVTILSLFACTIATIGGVDAVAAQGPATYPAHNWARVASPEELGWSTDALLRARAYSDSVETAAVMIIHQGVVLDEWGETTRKFNIHSARKSLLSGLYGLAVAEGVIDLESTLGELGIDDYRGLTEQEKSARVVDLLRSRSGVYHPANYVSAGNSMTWPERESHAPGTFWYYSNWDFNAAGGIYEQETGVGIYRAFMNEIANPIGMQDFLVEDGIYDLRTGFVGTDGLASRFPAYSFQMTARDMARYGLLYLREGNWNGMQIIPRDWVVATTRADEPTSEYGGHEYYWWIAIDGKLYPGVDVGEGAYAAHGAGGHKIVVLPEFDLVVVHRVNTDSRTAMIGGTESGESVSSSEFGHLLDLILQGSHQRQGRPQ